MQLRRLKQEAKVVEWRGRAAVEINTVIVRKWDRCWPSIRMLRLRLLW